MRRSSPARHPPDRIAPERHLRDRARHPRSAARRFPQAVSGPRHLTCCGPVTHLCRSGHCVLSPHQGRLTLLHERMRRNQCRTGISLDLLPHSAVSSDRADAYRTAERWKEVDYAEGGDAGRGGGAGGRLREAVAAARLSHPLVSCLVGSHLIPKSHPLSR